MKYTLVSSERSPFGRICRMFMLTHRIDFEFRVINFADDPKAAAELAKETPTNRVPFLIENDRKIFDSRVIINHLTQTHDLQPLSTDQENLVTAIYSALDASVALFLLRRDGFDVEHPGYYMSRQRQRLPSNLNYVTPWTRDLDPKNPRDWNYPSMALLSYLQWVEIRAKLIRVADYPDLARFLEKFSNAPGVKQTALLD